jgi:hypothetical protein
MSPLAPDADPVDAARQVTEVFGPRVQAGRRMALFRGTRMVLPPR